VRAALPVLQRAARVVILSNTDDMGDEAVAAEQDRMGDYLALHGVSNVSMKRVSGADVAKSLLAASNACDILVSGAYGRPRFYEWVLGGTTRALVSAAGGPSLLLAH
jgi:nucleotide-binding universal stress UspA family protein